jgi:hypothetical protein
MEFDLLLLETVTGNLHHALVPVDRDENEFLLASDRDRCQHHLWFWSTMIMLSVL